MVKEYLLSSLNKIVICSVKKVVSNVSAAADLIRSAKCITFRQTALKVFCKPVIW